MSPLLGALVLALSPTAPGQDLVEGDPAPPIEAQEWMHWIGDGPDLAALKGRPILIHFFKTEKPRAAGWLNLVRFHRLNDDLVVLAVTSESSAEVAKMLESYSLPFPIGTGSSMETSWGIRTPYAQVLVEPGGTVYFRADVANGLWDAKLMKGMKGARRLGEEAALVLAPEGEFDRRFARVLDPLADGDLAKGLKAIEDLRGSGSTGDEEQAVLEGLEAQVRAHVERLQQQAEAEIARGEVLLAHDALEALAKNLKRHALGERPAARLAELAADERFQRELAAARDYDRALEIFFRLGYEKSLDRFQEVVDQYPHTYAAGRCQNWIHRRW